MASHNRGSFPGRAAPKRRASARSAASAPCAAPRSLERKNLLGYPASPRPSGLCLAPASALPRLAQAFCSAWHKCLRMCNQTWATQHKSCADACLTGPSSRRCAHHCPLAPTLHSVGHRVCLDAVNSGMQSALCLIKTALPESRIMWQPAKRTCRTTEAGSIHRVSPNGSGQSHQTACPVMCDNPSPLAASYTCKVATHRGRACRATEAAAATGSASQSASAPETCASCSSSGGSGESAPGVARASPHAMAHTFFTNLPSTISTEPQSPSASNHKVHAPEVVLWRSASKVHCTPGHCAQVYA